MAEAEQSLSFWMAQRQIAPHPSLKTDLETDVCIIGAGIVGLTCAYLLSKSGKKVVVIDDGPSGGNQTERTTGHLVNVLDDRYKDLERIYGADKGRLIAQSHAEAVRLIESISLSESIDCRFERVDAYLFVPPGDSTRVLYEEYEAVKRAGIEVKMLPRAPIEFDTGTCLQFPHQAQFFPLRYLEGLIQAIERLGGEIYSKTHAAHIEDGKKTCTTTSQGNRITAGATIVATNSPVNNRFLMHTKQASYRTYVIAGKIPRGSVVKAIYYDTPDPYHYVRLASAHSTEEDNLIVGGEDHRTGEKGDPEVCYENLEKWTRARFPALKEIEFKWSGQIIEPVDSLAFLGKNPCDKNIYVATGDSGNGLTHGTLGAVLLTDLILGKNNPWKDLYDPSRKSMKTLKDYASENLNTLAQYRDWLTAGDSQAK